MTIPMVVFPCGRSVCEASVYILTLVCSVAGVWAVYLMPHCFVLCRYCIVRIAISRCACVGCVMCVASICAAYATSGLVLSAVCRMVPIMLSSVSWSCAVNRVCCGSSIRCAVGIGVMTCLWGMLYLVMAFSMYFCWYNISVCGVLWS